MHPIRGLAIVLSCATLSAAPPQDQIFRSPLGDFSVPYPTLSRGRHLDQHFGAHSGVVSFSSDLGEIYSIQVQEVDPSVAAAVNDPARAPVALLRFLDEFVVPQVLRKAAPMASIVRGEQLTLSGQPAYFAVASLPEAGVVLNVKAKKHADDTRGLLIVGRGKYVYVVTVGIGVEIVLGSEPNAAIPIEKTMTKVRREVELFYRSIQFKAP
jgi:hypothetical protein